MVNGLKNDVMFAGSRIQSSPSSTYWFDFEAVDEPPQKRVHDGLLMEISKNNKKTHIFFKGICLIKQQYKSLVTHFTLI